MLSCPILFVDDEPDVRRVFARICSAAGFDVDVASSAREAVNLVTDKKYAVVATDLRMPETDGLELIARLKAMSPDTVFLVVTGAPDDVQVVPPIHAVVPKPWSNPRLIELLQSARDLYLRRRKRESSSPPDASQEVHIVLVEDSNADAFIVRQLCKRADDNYRLIHCETLADGITAIEHHAPHLVLLDLSLPDAQGLEGVHRLRMTAPELPIVVLSGMSDEGAAVAAVGAGAQDYLVKGLVDGQVLHRSIRYALERKRAEQALVRMAHFDPLTSLANRRYFKQRMESAIARCGRRESTSVGVLVLDLDGFKTVNDSLGHDAGDALLLEVSKRLLRCVREEDLVARLGGDEFAIGFEAEKGEHVAVEISERILRALRVPLVVADREVAISGSLGVALSEDDTVDVASMLKRADLAMYRAKGDGRDQFRFFVSDMQQRAMHELSVREELRHAWANREFELFYQPQLDLHSGAVRGFEALLRWRHPERGLVSPVEFIPVLEDTGLIREVGAWVVEAACLQLREFQKHDPTLKMSVNVSARQLEDNSFPRVVDKAIERGGILPSALEVEITESLWMKNRKQVSRLLEEVRSIGAGIAVDDFGTGYSSLAYLHSLPVTVLKLDRAFIRDADSDERLRKLCAGIIQLGHTLEMEVIAEGVETETQVAFLLEAECDTSQGFLHARPACVADTLAWLDERAIAAA